MKDYNKIFNDWLELTEFELVKYRDRFGLIDLQKANLGDIESDRFDDAMSMLDRMDVYINDYLVKDIYEELFCEGGSPYPDGNWDSFVDEARNRAWCDEFENHNCDYAIEMLDMICNHPEEVSLSEVYERWYLR